jgi:hypothetical protein
MSITSKLYGPAIKNIMKGNIPDLSDPGTTIKVALMKSPFSFNQNHENWGQIKANECDDTDYTAGGFTLTDKVVSYSNRVTTFDTTANPKTFQWTAEGNITATHAVIYHVGDSDATSYLLCCIDFGGAQSSFAGKFEITFHTDGIFKVTVSA